MEKVKEVLSGKTIICNAYPLDIIWSITKWDKDIAYGVLETFPQHFKTIPLHARTQDMYVRAVELYPENLKLVPSKVLHYRFEDFLKFSPNETANLLDKEALNFLFKNKAKLKRVIDALPRPFSHKVTIELVNALLVRTYDEKLLKWIEEKYPSEWDQIVKRKQVYDASYHKDMYGGIWDKDHWETIEYGPSTKHGIRVVWYHPSHSDDGWYDDEPRSADWRDDEPDYPYRDDCHKVFSILMPYY